MRGRQIDNAKASFVSLDIGFRRRFQVLPGECHQIVAARTAKRLDHLDMVAARAIQRFRKCIGIRPDAVGLLGQQIDGFDQAGIAAESEQYLMKTEIAVEDGQEVAGSNRRTVLPLDRKSVV